MSIQAYCRRFSEKVEVEKTSIETMLSTLHEIEKEHADFIAQFVDYDKAQKSKIACLRRIIHEEIEFMGENPLEWEARLKDA